MEDTLDEQVSTAAALELDRNLDGSVALGVDVLAVGDLDRDSRRLVPLKPLTVAAQGGGASAADASAVAARAFVHVLWSLVRGLLNVALPPRQRSCL